MTSACVWGVDKEIQAVILQEMGEMVPETSIPPSQPTFNTQHISGAVQMYQQHHSFTIFLM